MTLEWAFPCVSAIVVFKLASRLKALLADVTHKSCLSGVEFLVPLEQVGPVEGAAAGRELAGEPLLEADHRAHGAHGAHGQAVALARGAAHHLLLAPHTAWTGQVGFPVARSAGTLTAGPSRGAAGCSS